MSQTTLEVLRVAMLIPQLALVYYFITVYSFQKSLWYFTTWSLYLVIVGLVLTIYLGRAQKPSKTVALLGTSITEIALVSQIFVVVIYWPVLHKPTVEFISKFPDFDVQYQLMVWIHLLPFFAIALNVWLSQIYFNEAHWPAMAIYGTFYVVVNFILVKYQVGKSIYPFLPWDNVASYIISFVLLVAGLFIFKKICAIVNRLKGETGMKQD